MSLTIVVIGGGAAGFFAAINSAQSHPNCKVVLLEKTAKLLSKVRVSGGGRCNVTHACFNNTHLIKSYPRGGQALKSAFNRFGPSDTIEWFENRGVHLKAEEDGRMFPDTDNSETIINCLLQEADKFGVSVKTNVDVLAVNKINEQFRLTLRNGGEILADKLLIATGGNPKEAGYNWLIELGHTITTPVPSLFTFNIPDVKLTQLMGVSVPNARVRITGTKLIQEGPLLITHWGLSGPAVLKSSAWGARILSELHYSFEIAVNWIPEYNEEKLRAEFQELRELNASKLIYSTRMLNLPKRLMEYFLTKAEININCRWADLPKKNANVLINILINDSYKVNGRTTFKEEFVTCGGINLNEIDFKTMQSTKCPGLYFAGEVLDIDGITGGFNFQSAWTTGWIAAQVIGVS